MALALVAGATVVALIVGLVFVWAAGRPRCLALFIGLSAGVCAASSPRTLAPPTALQARLCTGVGTLVVVGSALVGVSGVETAFPGSVATLILLLAYAGFMTGFTAGRLDVPRPAGKKFGGGATH